uniref:Retrotransposon gag domain-containing protein n=1 Tax=Tanacetum cinerariifolium TaxID=118510 RepID=A0A6L2P3S6_TANCI|nr:hypothetical protein [Tanacetum cinerariifolium]
MFPFPEETADKETTMAEPNDYITATQKKFISNDSKGRMVEKFIVEIKGTFLVKMRDNAFNGNIRENAFKRIDKFLKVVGPIKINGLTQDQFKLSVFTVSLAGAASEWFTKECIGSITTWDNMVEKFVLKFYHLFDHDEEEENEEDDDPTKRTMRFEMMKYSFNNDEEYITIKESEYLNHSKDSLGAYQELLRLIDEGWVVTTLDE